MDGTGGGGAMSPTEGEHNLPAANDPRRQAGGPSDDDDDDVVSLPAAKGNELVVIVGKHFPTYRYSNFFIRFPTLALLLTFGFYLTFAFIYLTTSSIETVGTLGLFQCDGPDSVAFQTVTRAVDGWGSAVRLNSIYGAYAPVMPNRELFITYRRADGGQGSSLFDVTTLSAIASLEQQIAADKSYQASCWVSPRRGPGINRFALAYQCTPLNSLMQYFYPGSFISDGAGNRAWEFSIAPAAMPQIPIDLMGHLIRSNSNWAYYAHAASGTDPTSIDVMRTSILLSSNSDVQLEQAETAIATILEANPVLAGGRVQVSYGGSRLYERRIQRLITGDTLIVMSLFLIIFAPLAIHFHSKIMALMAVLMLLCLYPCGVYLYFLFTGDGAISLLNVLSYIMVIVIALQAQTVFFSTFVQSGLMPTSGTKNTLTVAQRLSYTFRSAGLGISCASAVALACFAAISTVPIPAVKQFGRILVVLTLVLWSMMFTVFPSMVLVHHLYISNSRRNAQKKKEFLLEKQKHERNRTTTRYFKAVEKLKKQYAVNVSQQIPAQVAAAYLPSNPLALESYKKLSERMERQLEEDVAHFEYIGRNGPVFGQPAERISMKGITGRIRGFLGKWRDEPVDKQHKSSFGGAGANVSVGDNANVQLSYEEQVMREFDAAVEARKQCGTVPALPIEEVILVGHVSCDNFDGHRVEAARRHLHQSKVTSVYDMTTEHLVVVGKYFGVLPPPASELRVERRGAFGSSAEDEIKLEDIYNYDSPVRGGGEEADGGHGVAGRPQMPLTVASELILRSSRAGTLIKQLMYTMFGIAACIGPRVPASRAAASLNNVPMTRAAPIVSAKSSGDGGAAGPAPPPPSPPPPTRSAFVRWMQELTGRERTFIFFGHRTNESAADRRARILSLKDTSSAFSIVDRFLFNTYAPLLHAGRFIVIAIFVVLLILSAVAASKLVVSTSPQSFLPSSDPIGRYVADSILFASGTCDVCSAYFLSSAQLNLSYQPLAACKTEYGVDLMFGTVDRCGQCLGDGSECYQCAASPVYEVDQCGQCLIPANDSRFNNCLRQCSPAAKTSNCTHCQFAGYPDGVVGPTCSKTCFVGPSCPADRGTCNIVTGHCDCFQDAVRGYFTGNYCEFCYDSSLALPDCRHSKNATAVTCRGYIPGSCSVVDPSICDVRYGTLGPDGQTCNCNVVGHGGPNCALYMQCSLHGVLDVSSGACACVGQYFGPVCEYCRCLNGGSCDGNGTCICRGSWAGDDCSACPATVLAHQSICATPWDPAQYDTVEQCRQALCSLSDLTQGTSSSFLCMACAIAGAAPRSSTNVYATCQGYWSGTMCDVCNTGGDDDDDGVTCDAQGYLVGCDGIRTLLASNVKRRNRCGVCGGDRTSDCYGCDGVLFSKMQLSPCGVCAPVTNGSESASSSCTGADSLSQIYLVWGLRGGFDPTDAAVQQSLALVLRRLLAVNSDLISAQQSSSFFLDYVNWLERKNITFPVVPPSTALLYMAQFASLTNRQADMGMSDSSAAGRRNVTYLRQLLISPLVQDSLPYERLQDLRRRFQRALDDAMGQLSSPALREALGPPILSSQAWVNMEAQAAIVRGLSKALVIGLVVFSACALTVTRSLRISVLGILAFISNVLSVLALYFVLGWGLGTVEVITAGIVLGAASSQIIHFVESYRESLHAAQSHLLGNKISPLKGLQATLQRHGAAFLVSFLSIVISCCVFYACSITLLRRVATTIILCTLINLLEVFVFLPGLLAVLAPTQITQRRSRKIFFGALAAIVLIVGSVVVAEVM